MYKRLFEVDEWKIITHELPEKDMRLLESLTAVGNGFMGMRGNFEEHYSGDSHRGSYIAGVWFPDKTRVGWWKNGYPDYFGKVINSIDYIGVLIEINGVVVDLHTQKYCDFEVSLDMKNGILTRQYTIIIEKVAVALKFERLLSIVSPNIAAIRITAEALNTAVDITLKPYLNGNVTNEDSNYEEMFWEVLPQAAGSTYPHVNVVTKENGFGVERFQVTAMMANLINGKVQTAHVTSKDDGFWVEQETKLKLTKGQVITFDKIIAVVNDRHGMDKQTDLTAFAENCLDAALDLGYAALKVEQQLAWNQRWQLADVKISGDKEAQQGIRFNIFQLFSTYYGEDPTLNIGPKGFTGEKYGGATYWDTEAFIIPMYLSVADSKTVNQLLEYRWRHLAAAQINAGKQGLKGALYPMVTFNGLECHNEWEITFEEIHRNGAIAWAIWNYTNYNNDTTYLYTHGIEVLVAISRFWADRVHWSENRNQYEIHGVTGPNEYENNINNNYHTNNIARWTLQFCLAALDGMAQNEVINKQVNVSSEEYELWQTIAAKLFINYDESKRIFIQDDGFLNKELVPVAQLSSDQLPLHQNWSWDRILRSPYIKQADVLQSIYMLNHEYTAEQIEANFHFYEPFTVHESSLSAAIHSILAAQIGATDKAYELYQRTARLDLDNYNNDTEDGLHITSMSGAWLAIVHGFAGMRVHSNQLQFKPFLPKGWTDYQFIILYRNRRICVKIAAKLMTLQLLAGESVTIKINQTVFELANEIVVAI